MTEHIPETLDGIEAITIEDLYKVRPKADTYISWRRPITNWNTRRSEGVMNYVS